VNLAIEKQRQRQRLQKHKWAEEEAAVDMVRERKGRVDSNVQYVV